MEFCCDLQGYTMLAIDDCWVGGRNETTQELYPDPERFPHGIASLADYVHAKGLKLSIYTDVTTAPCIHGERPPLCDCVGLVRCAAC